MPNQPDLKSLRSASLIVFIYIVVGLLWIYFSDRFVEMIALNESEQTLLQTHKGWIFVLVTAAGLFWLIQRLLRERLVEYKAHLEEMLRRKQLEASLEASQTIFEQTGRLARIGRWGFDVATMEGEWNDETARIHDLEPSDAVSVETGMKVFSGEDRKRIEAALDKAISKQESYLLELRMTTYKGREKWVRTLGIPIVENGRTVRVEGLIQDISEQKNAQMEIERHEALLNTIMNSSPDAIFVKDLEGRYLVFNEGAAQLVGKKREAVLGNTDDHIFARETAETLRKFDREIIDSGRIQNFEEVLTTPDGTVRTYWATKGALLDGEGKPFGLFGISRDITLRKENEARLVEAKEHFDRLAHFDTLTGLPNRLSMHEHLNRRIAAQHALSLILLDLDGFKEINDSYGHRFGDRLLSETAAMLRGLFSEKAFIAHIGDDEFAVIIEDEENGNDMLPRVRALKRSFDTPFEIDEFKIYMTASVGIAFYPSDADDAETLFQNADTAMYEAKHLGKNTFSFYHTGLTRNIIERTSILGRLKRALYDRDLTLYYQPQVDPENGTIIGAEALLRWFDAEGAISPDRFIPIAEESGVILEVGQFVLEEGCRTAAHWAKNGKLAGRLALNVSARQLNHFSFMLDLERILLKTGCQPEWIELEITESSIHRNPKLFIALLERLKEKGFHISVDDFGTGYSSLAYLQRLPVDKLKIDQSFIRNITLEPRNQVIIKTIINLSKGLKLHVLAEGVEEVSELEFLRRCGIDAVQGFYYYRPMPFDDFEALLDNQNTKARASASDPF